MHNHAKATLPQRVPIVIETQVGSEVIQAYVSETPGLVVHKDWQPANPSEHLRTWGITHRVSGYRVRGGMKNRTWALKLAKALGEVTDWTESRSTLLAIEGIAAKVKGVVDSQKWWTYDL